MITILNQRELAVALSMEERDAICAALHAAGIPYRTRTRSHNGGRSRAGSLGIDMEHAYTYRIFVRREDYERACSLRR